MSLVLDSSVALGWIYSNEFTEAIDEVKSRVIRNGAWVTSIWRLEIANVLATGARRRRHDSAFCKSSLEDLALLPITMDSETDRQAWGPTLKLAERHRLSLYDAAYLELAQRRGLALATLDPDLRAAATKEKVVLLGI